MSLTKHIISSLKNYSAVFNHRCSNNKFFETQKFFSVSSFLNSERYVSPLPDSYYNEEQQEMQRSLSKIIETDINPFVNEWEANEEFPKTIFKKLGEAGFLGIDKEPEYGGLGLDFKYLAAILEEMGKIKVGGPAMGLSVHMCMTSQALSRFGTDELKKEFLTPSVAGDYISCVGVSEPIAGSDVANTQTTAVRQGDDYIINGTKIWTTNGMKADWCCLLANTSKGSPYKNKSMICVPLNLKGVSRTKIHKIGNRCSDMAQMFFEDVRVPAKNLIGDEGAGFFYQMLQFQEERVAGSLGVLKSLDSLLSTTIEYTSQRQAFGKSVLDNQYVHFRLGELATEIEALRALTYRATDNIVSGDDATRLASMVKLKAGRLAREAADACLQFWGGMGYTMENPASQFYRDGRALSIAGGADEVMLEIITKLMNINPRGRK